VARYEFETLDLKARIVAAGGTIQDDALRWADDFVVECKQRELWADLLEVGLFVGDQLAGALVKLKHTGTGTLANTGFVGGDYTERGASGGLLGANAKFLNTAFTLQASAAAMIGFYNRTVVDNAANRNMMGALDTQVAELSHTTSGDEFNWNTGGGAGAGPNNQLGFYCGARQSDNVRRLYLNGVELASGAPDGATTLPNRTLYLWARNNAGVAERFWVGRGSFYCIGNGNWTGAKIALLMDAVNKLQLKLGRS
jgi:hypothetical protein